MKARNTATFAEMDNSLKIAIAGDGNVASYLKNAFEQVGVSVATFSRKAGNLMDLNQHPEKFDVLLLCVSDAAISAVSQAIEPSQCIVAHVSGATPLSAIAEKHKQLGVFYPLMSLKGNVGVSASEIPFCLEASDDETLATLKVLVKKLGAKWNLVSSEERTHLHLAAVLAHNFSNHLHYRAEQVMKNAGLDFRILLPLLQNALKSLQNSSPKDMQTGPAMRNDEVTIARHLNLLNDQNTIDIYKLLTQSIKDTYDEKL